MGGSCGRNGGRRYAYKILVEIPKGRRPLGRPRRSWEYIIKTDLEEVGSSMNWIDLPQDRDKRRALVNAAMKIRVP
jgi:hypothetical protein